MDAYVLMAYLDVVGGISKTSTNTVIPGYVRDLKHTCFYHLDLSLSMKSLQL
jgi:hypothetical protein